MSSSSTSSASSSSALLDYGIWSRIFQRSIFASSEDLWRHHNPYLYGGGGCWATLLALFFILFCKSFHFLRRYSHKSAAAVPPPRNPPQPQHTAATADARAFGVITEDDLRSLIENLDERNIEKEKWDDVIERRSPTVYYKAKCTKPQDGPWKYLSVTEFANYSTDVLRDFYMDNEYRMQWDKTVVDHVQLQVDETTGTEMGRTIKKLPLLTARDYVLAWRLWEGKDNTYYCVTKHCNHPLAPKNKKYVRVVFYKSGWRIRKVPGKDASEIKLIYQEDSGMNVEMAKMAFSKGVWSYICKMEAAMQKYSPANRLKLSSAPNAITLMQKVPQELETIVDTTSDSPPPSTSITTQESLMVSKEKKLLRKPSRQLLAQGLLLLGGAICLSRGHSSLGAKVAMAYMFTKLKKNGTPSTKPNDKQG